MQGMGKVKRSAGPWWLCSFSQAQVGGGDNQVAFT
jgi:hypothetical protein